MGHAELFGTDSSNLAEFSLANVTSLSIFPDPVSQVITIEDLKKYIPTKLIGFLENQLKFPDNGQGVIEANNQLVNNLQSSITDGRAFIIGDINRVILRDLIIESTTGSGACFDIETVTAVVAIISLLQSRVEGFSAIGTVENSLFQTDGVAFIDCADGISLIDNDIVEIISTNFINQSGDHISVSGTLGTFRASNVTAAPSSGDSVFNFDSGIAMGSALITNCSFNDVNGGTFFAAAGLDQTDPRIIALNNTNAIDSNWIGSLGFKENAIATVVALNTYTDIAGIILAGVENERFTVSGDTITYIGLEDIKTQIEVSISASRTVPAASGRTIRAAVFIDSGSGFVEQADSFSTTMRGDVTSFSFRTKPIILTTGDKIKAQIKNEDTTDSILVVDYNLSGPKL